MYLAFVTKTRHKSVFHDNGNIIVTGTEMSKLFSFDYLTMHYSIMNCHRNVENRLTLSLQEEKIIDSDYYVEYLTSMSNKISL